MRLIIDSPGMDLGTPTHIHSQRDFKKSVVYWHRMPTKYKSFKRIIIMLHSVLMYCKETTYSRNNLLYFI